MVLSYYQNIRSELAPFIKGTPKRILEIGCGVGNFRQNITWPNEYWGVELSPEIAVIAQTQLDKVLAGSFDSVAPNLPDRYFDMVVCNDVIEHIFNTDNFLQMVTQHLAFSSKDDTNIIPGYLIGSIPNVRQFVNLYNLIIRGDWKYSSSGILDISHVRFFTRKSLARTFDANGYAIDVLKMINPWGNPSKTTFKGLMLRALEALIGDELTCVQMGFRVTPHHSSFPIFSTQQ